MNEKVKQIAEDLAAVLKEAKNMGCKEVKYFHNIPLENVEIVVESLEKYVPKKVIYDGDGYAPDGTFVWDEWLCPNCNSRYEVEYEEHDYCPNCGQAIDWSVEE